MASNSRQFGSGAGQRSQSVSESSTVGASNGQITRLNSLNDQHCASPSLKRVIKPNVVKMRRQQFEGIGQNMSDSNVASGRQVKSESSAGFSTSACWPAQGRNKFLRSTSEMTNVKFAAKSDVAHMPHATSVGLQTDSKSSVRQSCFSLREKPPVQPKPSLTQKQNLNAEVSSPCVSDSVKLTPDNLDSPNLDMVYYRDGNNNLKIQKEWKPSEVIPDSRTRPAVSPPVPPPKPPRCLSELGVVLDRKYSDELEGANGKYDYLGNAISVVLPTALGSEIIVSEQNFMVKDPSSTYASIDEVLPTLEETEVKTPQKPEKGKKSGLIQPCAVGPGKKKKARRGKTIQIDNPNYMRGHGSDTDEVIPCRPLVRRLSETDLVRKTRFQEELIYAEPYACPDLELAESRHLDPIPVELDCHGYAVPDLENNSSVRNKTKSKVSNAYAVLRLPNETGDSTQIEDAADDEVQDQEKRLIYVKHVRLKTSAAIAKYEQVKLKSSARLFQYGMIIGLSESEDNDGLKPKVLYCIPNEVSESDSFVCNFCFPDADLWKPISSYEGELFSFVLTSETGDRRYGWCKRYLPPGSGDRLPEALCIVSSVGEYGMYEQLLRALQEFRSHSMECVSDLLAVAYARPMPVPNKEVYIRTEIPNLGRQTIILKRASNSTLSVVPYSCLLEHLTVPVLLQVFGALLLERKIIFCASRLNTLSSCIAALVMLLHPFEWQHTYVTVLTMSLIDIVEAPTPYIVGILASMKSYLDDHDISDVLLVDLDNHCILQGIGDESRIIPKKIQRALTTALISDSDVPNASSSSTLSPKNRVANDATISEAFLRLFIETCSHYKAFILEQEDEETTFQRELFVKEVHSRSIRLFLDWFTQTQMFEVFMSGKLSQNAVSFGDFDQRITDYQEEMELGLKSSQKKKSFGKKLSAFFKESGDKIKRKFRKVYV